MMTKSDNLARHIRFGRAIRPLALLFAGLAVAAWGSIRLLSAADSSQSVNARLTPATDAARHSAAAAAGDADPHEPSEAPAEVVWQTEYEKAIAEARQTRRPVLIDFAASWCVPCRLMEKHTWSRTQVQKALSEDVIPLKVDMDSTKGHPLVEKFEVEFVPTVLLIHPDGKPIFRSGFVDAPQLLELLRQHVDATVTTDSAETPDVPEGQDSR